MFSKTNMKLATEPQCSVPQQSHAHSQVCSFYPPVSSTLYLLKDNRKYQGESNK